MANLSKLTISQLNELTGRDRRWIKKRLGEAGVEPVEERGRGGNYYAPQPALSALFDSAHLDAAHEQALYSRAKRELVEIELEQKRGALIPADETETFVVGLLSMVRTRLLSVPTKAAPEAHGSESIAECERIIRIHVTEALEALADTNVSRLR